MNEFSEQVKSILHAITIACKEQSVDCYLYGEWVWYLHTGEHNLTRARKLPFMLSVSHDFEIGKFYNSLIKNITINKELESSHNRYWVVSDNHELDFYIRPHLNLNNTNHIIDHVKFTVSSVFYDVVEKTIIDPNRGIDDLQADPPVVKSLRSNWDSEEIANLASVIGTLDKYQIYPNDLEDLKKVDVAVLKEPLDKTFVDIFTDILSLNRPGNAFDFLISTFQNSNKWLAKHLIDLSIDKKISLNEDIDINNLITEKKTKLINVYNEFFLSNTDGPETDEDKHHRLVTTFRLLFESPSIALESSYVEKVMTLEASIAKASESRGPEVSLFAHVEGHDDPGPCDYGECPECVAEECDPQCCCCHSVDIVSEINTRCHKQVILSCNQDGTGAGPDPDNNNEPIIFEPGCNACLEACDAVLMLGVLVDPPISCADIPNQDFNWWTIPPDALPCQCDCKDMQGPDCFLTCMTCEHLFCKSKVFLDTTDCFYSFEMTPGAGCCGNPAIVDFMFVIDFSGSMTAEINGVINSVQDMGDFLLTIGGQVRLGFTIYGCGSCGQELNHFPKVHNFGTPDEPTYFVTISEAADITTFTTALQTYLPVGGGDEFALWAIWSAAGGDPAIPVDWGTGISKYIFLVTDEDIDWPFANEDEGHEPKDYPPGTPTDPSTGNEPGIVESVNAMNAIGIRLVVARLLATHDNLFNLLIEATGGDISESLFDLTCFGNPPSCNLDDILVGLPFIVIPTSCACIDPDPKRIFKNIPECLVENPPEHCFNIPIGQCVPDQEDCDCTVGFDLNVCGNIVSIQPEESNLVCCSDIGDESGCDCLACAPEDCVNCRCPDGTPCGDPEICKCCCGPQCGGSFVCLPDGTPAFPTLRAAQEFVWCNCWTNAQIIITPGCSEIDGGNCCCPDSGAEKGDPAYPCSRLDPVVDEFLLENGICCGCQAGSPTDPTVPDNTAACCDCCIELCEGELFCKPIIDAQVALVFENCTCPPEECIDGLCPDLTPCCLDGSPCINCLCADGSVCGDPENCDDDEGGDFETIPCIPLDRCIVGESARPARDDRCVDKNIGCTSVRNPAVTVLNNGIALVAYESMDDVSVLKVEQFKSGAENKILPNREFNYGRLQHNSRWVGLKPKLYIYEDPPKHLLTGVENPDSENMDTWKDVIVFRTGPLSKQAFPLHNPPCGEDEIARFIQFSVPTDVSLTNPFLSSDDVYNIKWVVFDKEDQGLIGDACDDSTDGKDFIICKSCGADTGCRDIVDEALNLPPHIHNGTKVPIAHPAIAHAYNYMNDLENSHYVYIAYEAFEDNKWEIYLRQLRLSEYFRDKQIEEQIDLNLLVPIADLNITDVVYRVTCVDDQCTSIGNDVQVSRSLTMEVLLLDGREVFNRGLSGHWPSLCAGLPESDFPREKVFVQFVHSVVADDCPDQFGFNDIFFNWEVGDEFTITASDISPIGLYSGLRKEGESDIGIGEFDTPINIGGVFVSSASVVAIWYESIVNADWSVIDDSAFGILSQFKGLDIGEPILLTNDEEGHCTRPKIQVTANNDVFIAYESTESSSVQQIVLTGTAHPSSSLPTGILTAKDLDKTLNYFLQPSDFIFRSQITNVGVNQQADMLADFNDVIHLTWQSNIDGRWEIYYASSENGFVIKRITDFDSRSFKPRIAANENGHTFITWHDDRFGGWEIMMAYQTAQRILPLSQQDPYLASLRNRYNHTTDLIPLRIINDTNEAVCFNDISVKFYRFRTLEHLSFEIKHSEWPFAFHLPGGTTESDTTTQEFNETALAEWITSDDPYDVYVPDVVTFTGPEYDTFLVGSFILSFVLNFITLKPGVTVSISFRASDIPSDPVADSQWTDFVVVDASQTGFLYSSLGLPDVVGRYKQIRVRYNPPSGTPLDLPIPLTFVSVISSVLARICLGPGAETVAYLDLTPEVRVDKFGNEVKEFPIPVGFATNRTYFIQVCAVDDDGDTVVMPDPQLSVSCESCTGRRGDWDIKTCSLRFSITNDTADNKFYNAQCTFYYDKGKVRTAAQFNAFPGDNDLGCFTIGENEPAQKAWTSRGLSILAGDTAHFLLWPNLSPTAGLLCAIRYSVDIKICSVVESADDVGTCAKADLSLLQATIWECDCRSVRWDARFEIAPLNIRDVVRWRSSGDFGSDTRLTETGVSNLNPVIHVRQNDSGVVVYQSNRVDGSGNDPQIYKIYASVFSGLPASNMYASGAEAITSPFEFIVHQSDIEICPGGGCFDEVGARTGTSLIGGNVDFAFNHYDHMFLAFEQPLDSTECQEFTRDKQQIIRVNTCGVDPLDLFEKIEFEEDIDSSCRNKAILDVPFFEIDDPIFKTIVRRILVHPDDVKYHTTRGGGPRPVVSKCTVRFIVIGTPDTVSLRLRNGTKDYSPWIAFEPEAGDNVMEIPWELSRGSGLRRVSFQVATNAGVSATASVSIIADYDPISFVVKFYKPLEGSPVPDDAPDFNEDIFVETNILPDLEGISVAAIRPPTAVGEVITHLNSDYIYLEIIPPPEYFRQFTNEQKNGGDPPGSEIAPVFDFVHQGGSDMFSLPSFYKLRDDGTEVFRGVIKINKENFNLGRDGMAFIVPHFENDCADEGGSEAVSVEYIRDKYNLIVPGKELTTLPDDVWASERDEFGRIRHPIVLRPLDDPYFVFGDPNYRTKRNE